MNCTEYLNIANTQVIPTHCHRTFFDYLQNNTHLFNTTQQTLDIDIAHITILLDQISEHREYVGNYHFIMITNVFFTALFIWILDRLVPSVKHIISSIGFDGRRIFATYGFDMRPYGVYMLAILTSSMVFMIFTLFTLLLAYHNLSYSLSADGFRQFTLVEDKSYQDLLINSFNFNGTSKMDMIIPYSKIDQSDSYVVTVGNYAMRRIMADTWSELYFPIMIIYLSTLEFLNIPSTITMMLLLTMNQLEMNKKISYYDYPSNTEYADIPIENHYNLWIMFFVLVIIANIYIIYQIRPKKPFTGLPTTMPEPGTVGQNKAK